ncbi:single-stranded DNA-binding protein [Nostoc sp. FACHB-152]|uniref:single-stranded DNA-binding protein n=1 Tax=unclassified Nostoc TaxID=2593658 RepID=UPI001684EC63|nr:MULTISPECIES: single-stranded DNA-binding protein [unclassified Nostoc]MBD2446516.1 single-stranded DNA-binding protein [Nostoc sp. FACHB-152]MBD2468687.1 single-stranded DNA-binding protein [Nostoc sp. FACHB-145]
MNSCVLMADIIQEPQLRYTADNNLAVTEMLVQFSNSQRPEDPPATLKVVSWGNLATEVQQNYHQGDRVILEGRLGMVTFERRPEGFKEKRAELTIQRIHPVGAGFHTTPSATDTYSQPSSSVQTYTQADVSSYEPPRSAPTPATSVSVAPPATPEPTYQPSNFERNTYTPATEEPDPDDIPF